MKEIILAWLAADEMEYISESEFISLRQPLMNSGYGKKVLGLFKSKI